MSQEQNNNQKNQEQDLNQLLKVRREKLAALQEAGKDPFQITKYNQTHHTVDAKELQTAVNRFLRQLPERECNVFIRRCFYAESAEEIAARYGLRPNTVTVSLHRTRKKLREYLIKEGYL